jgi:uncharacterized membrane protein (DUF373 family)
MNNDKMMQQVSAIFGAFMVFFYLGIGIFLIFFLKNSTLNRSVIVLFGSVFIFYGLYRAFMAYVNIVKLFFRHDNDEE